jgi:formate hydrogenlyase transcriptional activator
MRMDDALEEKGPRRGESPEVSPASGEANAAFGVGESGMPSTANAVAETDEVTAYRYESLMRIASSIRAQQDPRELFGILVHELGQVVQFDAVAQYDEASNKVAVHLCSGCLKPKSAPAQIDKEDTIAAWVYERQETLVLGTLDNETRFRGSTRIMQEAGLQSVCALPLATAHRRLGSLVIGSVRRDAYSQDEVRFCGLVASQIALAMDDAINFRELQQAEERLQLLLDLTNRVVSSLNLRDVLREISANIRRVMRCDGAAITLPGPEDRKLRVYACDFLGSPVEMEAGFEPPLDKRACVARAFEHGEAAIISREELRAELLPPRCDVQSLATVPLKGRAGIVGVLALGASRERAFSADDLAFLTQIARPVAIAVENALAYEAVSDLKDKLSLEKLYLEDEIRSELKFEEIVGKSEALRRVLQQVETVAPTDSTVLIYGETGTGKELIARAVHNLGARHTSAFVKLNCAAIPAGLLESEMFGHERGAFTGAIAQRVGRFELANHGTLFLDEIGEVPLELQPKLLRVLQEREFERLGSSRTLRTNARLIAATNRDLEVLVSEQKFRADLYYRLNVFPIRVPALRERPEDIPLLVRHFVQQYSRQLGKRIDTIPSDTMTTLVRYPWPGNIRELQNVIERAAILTSGTVLNVPSDGLRAAGNRAGHAAEAAPLERRPHATANRDMRSVLDETERSQVLAALEQTGWIVGGADGAAALLGMKRSTLQSRIKRLGIHISRTGAASQG